MDSSPVPRRGRLGALEVRRRVGGTTPVPWLCGLHSITAAPFERRGRRSLRRRVLDSRLSTMIGWSLPGSPLGERGYAVAQRMMFCLVASFDLVTRPAAASAQRSGRLIGDPPCRQVRAIMLVAFLVGVRAQVDRSGLIAAHAVRRCRCLEQDLYFLD